MWPFSKRTRDLKSLPPIGDDSRKWGIAQTEIDGAPLFIRYCSSATDWVGHPDLSIKLGFAVPLNSPDEGAMPDPDENLQLVDVEDTIVREVASRTKRVFAVALTNGVMKEFVFYVSPGADIKSMHEAIQGLVSSHEVQCMAVTDPDWESYKEFAPN